MLRETFQASICYNLDYYGLRLKKQIQNPRKLDYRGKEAGFSAACNVVMILKCQTRFDIEKKQLHFDTKLI